MVTPTHWLARLKALLPGNTQPPKDEQSSRLAMLQTEYAGHPSRGLTPQKLAQILDAAEQGDILAQCDLFDDMEERDAHLFAELSKRRRSVLGLDWSLVPPADASNREREQTAELEALLRGSLDMEDVIWNLTDAIGKGFAALEIGWGKTTAGHRLIDTLTPRPQRWFTLPPDNRNELRLRSTGIVNGEPLWPLGWVVHRHAAKNGWLPRQALFRVLAWPYLFKHYSVQDLAEFLEIYGLPLRLGKYPTGASDKEKATLLRAVMAVGHAAAGIIPEGMSIDFQHAADGQADPFKTMIEWTEAGISKAIVGQTLSSAPAADGSGSRALGEVHNEVRWDITVSDARQLQTTLTEQLVLPLGIVNGLIMDQARAPRLLFDVAETEDLGSFAQSLPPLVGLGMRIPVSWAHEKLGIPQAANEDAVLTSPTPAVMQPFRTKTAALTGRPTPAGDPTDILADALVTAGQPQVNHWLDSIRVLLDQADSLEEFRALLMAAFGDEAMPTDALAATLAEAFEAAHAAGRFDIENR